MYADDVFGRVELSHRSQALEAALTAIYYTSFIMSFMGVPLLLHGIGEPLGRNLLDEVVVISTQIALVGSIYFPFAMIAKFLRGHNLDQSQAFCGFGSIAVAIVFSFVLMKYDDEGRLHYLVFLLSTLTPPLVAWLTYKYKFQKNKP